jgi:hypothetical protein
VIIASFDSQFFQGKVRDEDGYANEYLQKNASEDEEGQRRKRTSLLTGYKTF